MDSGDLYGMVGHRAVSQGDTVFCDMAIISLIVCKANPLLESSIGFLDNLSPY